MKFTKGKDAQTRGRKGGKKTLKTYHSNWFQLLAKKRWSVDKSLAYVYLFKCYNRYKIGISKNIERRLIQLQNNTPFPVEYIYAEKMFYARKCEKLLHIHYKKNRRKGEWFEFSLQEIDKIIEKIKNYPKVKK